MVGVPRSTGCQLCRKRRVKCDEARPGCSNCYKYGAQCPGYARGIKFVAGKHTIRQRKKHPGHPDEATPTSETYSPFSSVPCPSPKPKPRQLSPVPDWGLVTLPRSPKPNRAEYVQTVVASVAADVSQDITGFLYWCELDRLGSRVVLDGAVCSLAMQLLGKENKDEGIIAHSRTIYVCSLVALQKSLRHAVEWKASETLCSAMLLCVFELFAGTTSSTAWLMHARGIGTLMEQRGAAAHAEGWDASMVLAFRGILIISDMFFPLRDHCFLSRPEWKAVGRDGGRHLLGHLHHGFTTIEVVDEYFERLAEIPGVLKQAMALRKAKNMGTCNQTDKANITVLALRAVECKRLFSLWHAKFLSHAPLGVEMPSEDPDSPFDRVLHYEAPWKGAMHMSYWASMLILQGVLVSCEWPDDGAHPQAELVLNILRSIETIGAGTMGPYKVGYAIRVAYEFASAELQRWIRRVLDRFKKTYAATDKSVYPMPRTDNGGVA